MDITPSTLTVALTLPYPSLPSPSKKWREVVRLSQNYPYNKLVAFLVRQNMIQEKDRLEIHWVEKCHQLIFENRCLSFFCKNYPTYWNHVLGNHSPPSLWWNQVIPNSCDFPISIVGNRQIQPYVEKWTTQCAYSLAKEGFSIISGGAIGVDRAAAIGSLQANKVPVEILPFGIDQCHYKYSACRFSIFSPRSIFSTMSAMARNKLIYAYSPHTIVVQSNEQSGGTWHGTINALQKKLSCIHIWNHPENKGFSKLVELGAVPFNDLDELFSNLRFSKGSGQLFSI